MSDSDNIITIKILDRTYSIKCPAEEAQQLQESATLLDEQMRKIRQAGGGNSTDRIAVVAALNICHEMMLLKQQKNNYIDTMNQQIQDLQNRIKNFLGAEEEVAV